MARLIDADELMEKFHDIELNAKHELFGESRDLALEGLHHIKKALKEMPTIDPVKHGRWIICREFDHKLKCSQCGCHTVWMDEVVPNYCPYCGARMIELKK